MNLTFFSFPRRGLEETQAGQTPRAAGGCAGCEGRGRGKPTPFIALPSTRSPPVTRLCWTFILFAEKKEVRFTFLNPTDFPHIPPSASVWARAPVLEVPGRDSGARLASRSVSQGTAASGPNEHLPRTPGPARPGVHLPPCRQGVRPPKAPGSFTSPRSLVCSSRTLFKLLKLKTVATYAQHEI